MTRHFFLMMKYKLRWVKVTWDGTWHMLLEAGGLKTRCSCQLLCGLCKCATIKSTFVRLRDREWGRLVTFCFQASIINILIYFVHEMSWESSPCRLCLCPPKSTTTCRSRATGCRVAGKCMDEALPSTHAPWSGSN